MDKGKALGIEVNRLDDKSVLVGWTTPEYAPQKGRHGLKDPEVDANTRRYDYAGQFHRKFHG